jgi:hypothetical protein
VDRPNEIPKGNNTILEERSLRSYHARIRITKVLEGSKDAAGKGEDYGAHTRCLFLPSLKPVCDRKEVPGAHRGNKGKGKVELWTPDDNRLYPKRI